MALLTGTTTYRAVRLAAPGRPLEDATLAAPVPGDGEVVVRVMAAGICHSDAHYRAGVLQRLGEMYEAKGNVDKAITHYQAFVELWKSADPELQPRVRDVRGRIERLQRRRG